MLNHTTQERFLPEKEPLHKILQHIILWWVDLDQLPASHQLDPSLPSMGWGEENRMKKLMGQEEDKTHLLPSLTKQTSLGKEIFLYILKYFSDTKDAGCSFPPTTPRTVVFILKKSQMLHDRSSLTFSSVKGVCSREENKKVYRDTSPEFKASL